MAAQLTVTVPPPPPHCAHCVPPLLAPTLSRFGGCEYGRRYYAAERGNLEGLRMLLEAKAGPQQSRDNGMTPLMVAAQNGHAACVELLLAVKCTIKERRHDTDEGPLHMASQSGGPAMVTLLAAAKASVNEVNKAWATPLMLAVTADAPRTVRALCEARADVEARHQPSGLTVLMLAAMHGRTECARVLAAPVAAGGGGANVEAEYASDGSTAVYVALM